ncbi:YcaO-like family protein [Paenibacillus sp. VCA1]|uniref:YcaO-like family protein n=1 Tax=Paenibacillus sp. VCA1 TaxID=3039148 RepID=UPI0028722EE3|nr:YcaO-like family protein [Paenibacillus sp. VCA1]MDR9852514.1 YcaO-like family protein [Paenibacillus sp. VCA1]
MIATHALNEVLNRREQWTLLEVEGERLPCLITYGDRPEANGYLERKLPKFALLHVDAHECIVGPVFCREEIGCPSCFLKRRAFNLREHEYRLEGAPSRLVGDLQVPEDLVMECFGMLLRKRRQPGLLDYYRMNGNGLLKRLTFWPAERCSNCSEGGKPDDAEAFAAAFREKAVYPYGDSYRKEGASIPSDVFRTDNTDSNFIVYKDRNTRSFFSVSTFFRVNREEKYGMGIGSTTDYRASERKSLFEALERYAGMHPRGRERTVTCASFNAMRQSGHVTDPRIFIRDVAGSSESLVPFDENGDLPWIPAYSWSSKALTHIPESLAYYKMDQNYSGGALRVYKGNSNGNALGTGLLDSVYYACLELIERDAFLNHWYLRHAPPEIRPESVTNGKARYMCGRLEQLDYDVRLFDITMDTGIPVIWALCFGRTPDKFAAYSTSAAHPDPEKAIQNALEEMLLALEFYDTHTGVIREKAKRIQQQGVREVEDHPILYFLPEERHHFDFLFGGGNVDLMERFADYYENLRYTAIDMASETSGLLDRLKAIFGDVILVRQTPEGYTHLGLEVVKVLIPHLQQLWFGEEHRMLSRKRLEQAARFWGVTPGDIQHAPHPFP